jgi:hypothetical protein
MTELKSQPVCLYTPNGNCLEITLADVARLEYDANRDAHYLSIRGGAKQRHAYVIESLAHQLVSAPGNYGKLTPEQAQRWISAAMRATDDTE